jgi:hypothetical protein
MPRSTRVAEFDVQRPGYGGKTVTVYVGGTTTPASVYSDPALTVAAANPQTLTNTLGPDGVTAYGKWIAPIYVGTPYELKVGGTDATGIERLPLYDFDGVDMSTGTAEATRGTVARTLAAHFDDVIHVSDFGTLGNSSAANTTTLAAAIGAAATQQGGKVLVPPGNWTFTTLTLPAGVILAGDGSGVCTLRSLEAQAVVTLGGNGAGLAGITLDGVNLLTASIGVYAVGRTDVVLDDVVVKRFDTGIHVKGGDRMVARRFYLSNCNKGADFRGDDDASASAAGGPFRGLLWEGGKVDLCTTWGVKFSFIDDIVQGADIFSVDFLSNACPAVFLNGARSVQLDGCRWASNTTNIQIQDDTNASRIADNTARQFAVNNGRMNAGQILFNGICDKVLFDRCDFVNISFVLSIPTNAILLLDCREDAACTSTGATSKLLRYARSGRGQVPGVTTDNTWTIAWSLSLNPGEIVRLRGRFLARQRDGVNQLSGEIVATGSRAPANLGFDTAVGTLAIGSIVSGGTSGASGRVVSSTQSGTAGSLGVRDIQGIFVVGETLATSTGQTARCASPLDTPAVTVNSADVASVTPAPKTDSTWDYTVDAQTPLVRVKVKGGASQIVEWLVEVDVMRP